MIRILAFQRKTQGTAIFMRGFRSTFPVSTVSQKKPAAITGRALSTPSLRRQTLKDVPIAIIILVGLQ